jgi:hypothetical protein
LASGVIVERGFSHCQGVEIGASRPHNSCALNVVKAFLSVPGKQAVRMALFSQ